MPVSNVPDPVGDDAVYQILGEVTEPFYADNAPRDTRHPSQMELTRSDLEAE